MKRIDILGRLIPVDHALFVVSRVCGCKAGDSTPMAIEVWRRVMGAGARRQPGLTPKVFSAGAP